MNSLSKLAIPDRSPVSPQGIEVPRSTAWALVCLSLSMLLSSLGIGVANVALPTLAEAFDASFHEVQWVVLGYLLSVTTLVVSGGRLGDIVGRRRLLMLGLLLFIAASIACGLAQSLWQLVLARTVQGIGAAAMMALTLSFVGDTVSKERTGSAMGLLGTMSALGTALGPSLGGLLMDGPGWRTIFLINVPLGLVALVLARRTLPAGRPASERAAAGFDVAGSLVLAATLTVYMLAMTLGRGRFGPLNIALLSASFLGLALFVLAEARARRPLIQLATFRDTMLDASLLASAGVSAVVMTTMVVGPFYLAHVLRLDAATVGLVVAIGPVAVALMGIPAGRAVDRFGARGTTMAGLLVIAAGCFGLSVVPETTGILGYVVPLLLVTPGYALFQTANNTDVMAGIPLEWRGVISGVLNLSRNLGLVTGAAAMGAVFVHASGSADIVTASPSAVAAGMRTTFAAAGTLALAAFAAVMIASRAQSARCS